MNNGQPPYGDPPAWGQQGNQMNPAQPPVQQPYGQQGYYPQGGQQGYSQPFAPVATYGQQTHPQQVYQQQSWQPYDASWQPGQLMNNPYAQPGVNQPYYEQPLAPQNPYPQTMPPQNPYAQAAPPQNPYAKAASQSGQPQGEPQPRPVYPQFNMQGQPVQQGYGNGYNGYYSQSAQKRFELPYDVVGKLVVFGILPVLFILAMVFSAPALKWVFLAGAIGGIVMMWMREFISPNMRFTMSLVLGVTAVIALVGALSGAPEDKQNQPGPQGTVSQQQSGANSLQNTATFSVEPRFTPAPEDATDAAVEQLLSFFYYWANNNEEAMLARTAPSWRNSVENPARALFQLKGTRVPQEDYEVTTITGTDQDAMRTATVKVSIDRQDGRAKLDRYSFRVLLKKEDGIWYVDPEFMSSNEKETATETALAANATDTQPPLYTGNPSTILYYNPQGGTRYHIDPDCKAVGKRYKPMASFMYTQLQQQPYKALRPCTDCGAPIPDD